MENKHNRIKELKLELYNLRLQIEKEGSRKPETIKKLEEVQQEYKIYVKEYLKNMKTKKA